MPISFLEEVKDVISSKIPTSPKIATDILKIIYDKSSNVNDLANIIEKDPPITATILKISNSSFYSPITPIDTLKRAIVTLGFNTVRDIATSASIIPYFFSSKDSAGIDLPGLWLHSIGTANASQLISEKLHFGYPEIAYTVGLLHDIGKIIIWVYFPEHYYKINNQVSEKKSRIIFAERKVLNTDHTMIGEILCDQWYLPENISTAIAYHHSPNEINKEDQKLARIIELGDYICRKVQIGYPGDELTPKPSKASLALFGRDNDIINDNLDIISERLIEQKPEIEEMLSNINSRK